MFFITLYLYVNLSCNCTLSEHAIKSQQNPMRPTQIPEFSTGFSTDFSTGTRIQHLVSKGTLLVSYYTIEM